jgi:hypothetical protein
MKSTYISITAVALFSLLTVSCSDDFVNRDPVYSIDSENYFNSKQIMKMLVAAYDPPQSYVNVMLGR